MWEGPKDVWECEIDRKSFTVTDGLLPNQLAVPLEQQAEFRALTSEMAFGSSISTIDPPKHTPLRSSVSDLFKPGAAAALEDFTRSRVRQFIDDFAERGECDVVGDLAMRTSVRVACHLIGLPEEDVDFFVSRCRPLEAAQRADMSSGKTLEKIAKHKKIQGNIRNL